MKKILDVLKLDWINDKWRPGSMGEADKKSAFRFVIGGTIVLIIILSMQWFNLFDTYLHQYYLRAEGIPHFFSWIFGLGSIYALWKMPDFTLGEKSGWIPGVLVLALLLASILVGAGFNFDLHGIGN